MLDRVDKQVLETQLCCESNMNFTDRVEKLSDAAPKVLNLMMGAETETLRDETGYVEDGTSQHERKRLDFKYATNLQQEQRNNM